MICDGIGLNPGGTLLPGIIPPPNGMLGAGAAFQGWKVLLIRDGMPGPDIPEFAPFAAD